MATTEVVPDLPKSNTTYNVAHPLCPLTAAEISRTAELVQSAWPSKVDLRFKVITLLEPAKKDFIPYLDAEHSGRPLPQIPRKALSAYYIRNTVSCDLLIRSKCNAHSNQNRFHEAVINLSTDSVENNVRLGANIHGNGDYEELLAVEKQALEDEKVKAEIAKLNLPEGTVVCADPWIYGTFESISFTLRQSMAFVVQAERAFLRSSSVAFCIRFISGYEE